MFPDAQFQRSQDLDDLFCPTGSIWIANAKELKDSTFLEIIINLKK